jgi:hypothetical protein
MTFFEPFFDVLINFIPDADRYPVFTYVMLVNKHDRITRKTEGK